MKLGGNVKQHLHIAKLSKEMRDGLVKGHESGKIKTSLDAEVGRLLQIAPNVTEQVVEALEELGVN